MGWLGGKIIAVNNENQDYLSIVVLYCPKASKEAKRNCEILLDNIRDFDLLRLYFQKLTRGDDNWSLSEIMHALVLLTHFHALSSFVYGCGINAEIDHPVGHTFKRANSTGCVSGPSSLEDHHHHHLDQLSSQLSRSHPHSPTTTHLPPSPQVNLHDISSEKGSRSTSSLVRLLFHLINRTSTRRTV